MCRTHINFHFSLAVRNYCSRGGAALRMTLNLVVLCTQSANKHPEVEDGKFMIRRQTLVHVTIA